jgi:cytochrome c biogenesis protein CcmG/thiol:disulfide interchange protein DsbE
VNWKRALWAMLAAVPVIWLFAFGFTRDPGEIPSPLPGRDAPSFALEVFAPGEEPLAKVIGDTIDLGDLAGNVVVLNFWASWCLACRDEHTALSDAARHYAGSPVQFLGVLYNDRPPAAVRWISNMGGQSYPSVLDPGARTAIAYGLYGVPETFIVGRDARIAYKQLGPITERVLRTWVDSLLTVVPSGAATGGAEVP